MALKPLKISEHNAPLSCQQYDDNLDRTLDRANHTGTQTCDTISDLEECISDLDVIQAIQDLLDALQQQIESIEESLSNDGEISDRLNALRNELLQKINESRADIVDLQTRMADAEIDISSLIANLRALQELVEFYNTNQTNNLNAQITRINNFNSQVVALANSVAALSTSLSNETTARQNAVTTLQTGINNEIAARQVGDATLQTNITNEGNGRRDAINALTTIVNTKAPVVNPTFLGTVTINNSNGSGNDQAEIHSGKMFTQVSDHADSSFRVPNTAWCWGHFNNINTGLSHKAGILDPIFTNNVNVNTDLNVGRHFGVGQNLVVGGFGYVPNVDENNFNAIVNRGWALPRIDNLQNQINGINGNVGGVSTRTAKAFVAFNGRNTAQIYNNFNISGISHNAKGDYTIYFSNNVSGSYPVVVATCSRWPSNEIWGGDNANPHVMVYAQNSAPHLNGSYVRIYVNANDTGAQDPTNAEYVSLVVFANG